MRYDVALSFAGEDREYVGKVADDLQSLSVRVFYDEYESVTLWGKDLYVHLEDVYRNQAQFTVMFISKHYANKLWPNHERASAQARALEENREYILPVRFDHTEVPGLLPQIGYIDLRTTSPDLLAKMIKQKLELANVPPGTAYSQLSNQQLAVTALTFVGRLRDTLFQREREDRELNNAQYLERAATGDEEQSTEGWRRYIKRSDELRAQFIHEYSSRYKVEAILLRDEMLARLSNQLNFSRKEFIEHTYEYPPSPYEMRDVVDDLEKLARSLP